MAVYQPGIPTGTVNLDSDYLNIQGNFMQANIVYGTDHYPFDNNTPNQGFHNTVTTPPVVNNPPDGLPPATAAGILKLYAYQQYGAIGPIHYSRGQSNAVPTPLTKIYGGPSNVVFGTPFPIMDFTGIALAIFNLTMISSSGIGYGPTTNRVLTAMWNGTAFSFPYQPPTSGAGAVFLFPSAAASVLNINNASATVTTPNVYWVLDFVRIN